MNAFRGFALGLFITAVLLALWGPGVPVVPVVVIVIGGGWLSSLIWLGFELWTAPYDPWDESERRNQ